MTTAAPEQEAVVPFTTTDHSRKKVEQLVASTVKISLDRSGRMPVLRISPDPVQVYYVHDHGRGSEMRPHSILWMLDFRLELGETITIRVDEVTNFWFSVPAQAKPKRPVRPRIPVVPNGPWVISHGENAVLTEVLRLTDDNAGRIDFKYSIEFDSPTYPKVLLDPGGNLIPDP